MNDNMRIAVASAMGALIGGAAGYFFLTERGRVARRQFAPAIDELKRELGDLGKSLEGASGLAREGWKLLQELAEDDSRYRVTH